MRLAEWATEPFCAAAIQSRGCLLWIKARSSQLRQSHRLKCSKQTSRSCRATSVRCQKWKTKPIRSPPCYLSGSGTPSGGTTCATLSVIETAV